MSLDKAIIYKKEHRKPYTGAKSIDAQCRNHGTCDYCIRNRLYNFRKNNEKMMLQLKEYENQQFDCF